MPINSPTSNEISDNIVSQMESSLNQSIPLLPRSFVRVLAKALSGVFLLLYKYAGWIFLQMFVRTASWQSTTINGRTVRPLVEWGVLVGAGEPEAATRAELRVQVTVRSQGGSIRSGRQLVKDSTGVTYITLTEVPLNADTVEVSVRAVNDQDRNGGRGVIGNLEAGDSLSFASPPADIERETVVLEQEVTGADGEGEDAYRQRVIDRFRQRPQGGAYADYQEWATDPAGIIAAYPYTGDPGEVDVYIEATVESSGSPDGIPTTAQIQTVGTAIDRDPETNVPDRRPANALVNVLPIIRTPFDVTINGLDVDDVSAAETLIENACDEYLRSLEPFILGLSVLPRRDVISNPELSGIIYAVVTEQGGTFESLVIEEDSAEVVRRALTEGEKAKLGNIVFAGTIE